MKIFFTSNQKIWRISECLAVSIEIDFFSTSVDVQAFLTLSNALGNWILLISIKLKLISIFRSFRCMCAHYFVYDAVKRQFPQNIFVRKRGPEEFSPG